MRKLLASVLVSAVAATGVLAAAPPASAGPLNDLWEGPMEPVKEQAVCEITESFRDNFPNSPFHFVFHQLHDRVAGCDDSGSEALKLADQLAVTATDVACAVAVPVTDALANQVPWSPHFEQVGKAMQDVSERTIQACSVFAPDPGDLNVRELVPDNEARIVYDVATVFPCALNFEFVRQTGEHPLADEFMTGYHALGCADNEQLPDEFKP